MRYSANIQASGMRRYLKVERRLLGLKEKPSTNRGTRSDFVEASV
jgi:hypothetical protein